MSSGYDVHTGTTRDVGASTGDAAGPLGDLAGGMPADINAGIATGTVIDYLRSLADTMQTLTQAAQQVGHQVAASVDTYDADDHHSAAETSGVDVPTGTP